jgi:PAS domain S-box-containing protein
MKLDLFSNTFPKDDKISFYNKLLSQIPDLIFQMTVSPQGDIHFPYLSDSAVNHFELTTEEIKSDALQVFRAKIVQEDIAAIRSSMHLAIANMQTWLVDFRCNLPARGIKWFRLKATIERDGDGHVFYGRVHDNTENRIQALKLKISEERYQFALEASSEGIWDLDINTNKVFFSAQSMKILDFEERDSIMTKDKWDDRIHPDDREGYERDILKHLENRTPFYKNLQRVLTRHGKYKWILSRGKVIHHDQNGKPLRVIGTHTDISAQIEKEQELKRTLELLSEQNKKLLNFAHIVSHNLRSHAGNFNMLLDIVENEEDEMLKKETLKYIRTNSDALSETIENLKELVAVHSDLKPYKDHLNLRDYLTGVLNLLGEEFARHQVSYTIDIDENETVFFNPAYLESILLNFTTNAVKYSRPDVSPVVKYTLRHIAGQKVLSIEDNGLGIDLDRHGGSLFGMYKTFHKHPNSRGLGLFMSRNQIEAMGGSITVESKPNLGTKFNIYFNE